MFYVMVQHSLGFTEEEVGLEELYSQNKVAGFKLQRTGGSECSEGFG